MLDEIVLSVIPGILEVWRLIARKSDFSSLCLGIAVVLESSEEYLPPSGGKVAEVQDCRWIVLDCFRFIDWTVRDMNILRLSGRKHEPTLN